MIGKMHHELQFKMLRSIPRHFEHLPLQLSDCFIRSLHNLLRLRSKVG